MLQRFAILENFGYKALAQRTKASFVFQLCRGITVGITGVLQRQQECSVGFGIVGVLLLSNHISFVAFDMLEGHIVMIDSNANLFVDQIGIHRPINGQPDLSISGGIADEWLTNNRRLLFAAATKQQHDQDNDQQDSHHEGNEVSHNYCLTKVITFILTLFHYFCKAFVDGILVILKDMKLTYQTAVATLIQFIVLGLLNIIGGIASIVTTWHHQGTDHISNLLASIIFFLLIVGWFGVLVALGYGAQERRNKRLAQVLIAAELLTLLVALFNIKLAVKYNGSLLSLGTSIADVLLAAWVITLAFRLMKAGGRRITVASRSRHRPAKV